MARPRASGAPALGVTNATHRSTCERATNVELPCGSEERRRASLGAARAGGAGVGPGELGHGTGRRVCGRRGHGAASLRPQPPCFDSPPNSPLFHPHPTSYPLCRARPASIAVLEAAFAPGSPMGSVGLVRPRRGSLSCEYTAILPENSAQCWLSRGGIRACLSGARSSERRKTAGGARYRPR